MFDFKLFPEQNKDFFFQKKPTIFGPLSPFLSKTECSPKFSSYHFLILTKYHCAKFRGKSNEWNSKQHWLQTHACTHKWYRHIMKHLILQIILTLK